MADFVLTLTIPDLKRADAFTWFEAVHPIPQIARGGDDDDLVDEFTSEQWMAEQTRRSLVGSIAQGKKKLGTPTLERDEEIVTR